MIVDNYLSYLNEGKNEYDTYVSNPYDYQSLTLDNHITKQDIQNLGKWMKKTKEFVHPIDPSEPVFWLQPKFKDLDHFISTTGKKDPLAYLNEDPSRLLSVIIDKGNRVGVVIVSPQGILTWASWVPGHNYATRGTMKIIDKIVNNDYKNYKSNIGKKILRYIERFKELHTYIYNKNIPSIKTALKLKMKSVSYSDKFNEYRFELKYPFWWMKKN